jgi:hypothetical protein
MKRKVKRFAEGDEVIDMRSDTSMPTGIDDSVRARAMKFLEKGMKDEEPSSSKPRAMIKKTTKSIVESPKSKSYSEPKGFRVPEAEPGLEAVHPEDYLPGSGILKGLARGASRLIEKQAIREAEKKAKERAAKEASKEAKDNARRSAEGYSPEEAVRKLDEPARVARTESSGAMRNTFRPEEIREGFKRGGKTSSFKQGGSVKRSSASSRADGCATKGHTRGKIC